MRRRELLACMGSALVVKSMAPAQAAAEPAPVVRGVKLGITTGSLNPLPVADGQDRLAVLLAQCKALGIWGVELSGGFFGPALIDAAVGSQTPKVITAGYTESREALRRWRLSDASHEDFRKVRDSFRAAGVNLFSMSNTIADDCTDAEIDAMFRQMQTLGVRLFQSNQTRVHTALRLGPFAEKYSIHPSFHTHAASQDPDEIASVASLEKLLNASTFFRVCLDIGHFTAGNNDAVDYLRKRHDRITHLHVKDRKRDNGPNVAWGDGATPIKECLHLVRDNNWGIPCFVEREFKGGRSPQEETAGCLDYMRAALRA